MPYMAGKIATIPLALFGFLALIGISTSNNLTLSTIAFTLFFVVFPLVLILAGLWIPSPVTVWLGRIGSILWLIFVGLTTVLIVFLTGKAMVPAGLHISADLVTNARIFSILFLIFILAPSIVVTVYLWKIIKT